MNVTPAMALTIAGIIFALWGTMFGYLIVRLGKVEAKQDSIDGTNTAIQTQLSQIQTDLAWIKKELCERK